MEEIKDQNKNQLLQKIQLLEKQLLKTFEESEKYKQLFQNSLDAILLTSPDGKIYEANPAACEIFGMTEKEICKTGRNGLVDNKDERLLALLEERIQHSKAKGKIFMLRKNGEKFQAEISSSVFSDHNNNVRTCMIIRDISSQLQKEQELIESETKFRQVLESISLVGLMLDANANIIFANDFLLEITGWKREEVIGKNWFDYFIPNELISEIPKIFNQTIEQGAFPLHHINEIVRKDGKRLAIKWSNTTHLNDEKKPVSITSIGEDITQQIITEKELNKHREKLEELVKERTNELEKAMHEMEKMNELFIGREFRIKALKDEIQALKEKYEH